MNKETKILSTLGLLTLVVFIVGIFFFSSQSSGSENSTPVDTNVLYSNIQNQTGDQNRPVQIVEFGDFQCPSCKGSFPITEQLLADRGGQINFIFRHFPLPQHANAMIAAQAAQAAANQGKFWDMYKLLYQNQDEWANLGSDKALEKFQNYASQLELNVDQFILDSDSQEVKDIISKDLSDAHALGVDATPTFYINAVKLESAPTYDNFISTIDKLTNNN
jgi:protein-disulfide isomerase